MTQSDVYLRSPAGLGAYVAERREQLGLTQSELAKKAGVSRSWVARFESDSSPATFDRVMRTLTALGVDAVMRLKEDRP
ncbi:MAG: helix-turn-helix domain-containing protein [Leucobacter sp.]